MCFGRIVFGPQGLPLPNALRINLYRLQTIHFFTVQARSLQYIIGIQLLATVWCLLLRHRSHPHCTEKKVRLKAHPSQRGFFWRSSTRLGSDRKPPVDLAESKWASFVFAYFLHTRHAINNRNHANKILLVGAVRYGRLLSFQLKSGNGFFINFSCTRVLVP